MKNVINSGDPAALKLGEVMLTNLRKISGGFVQMELAEAKEGGRGLSAAFVFNQSDSRFSLNSVRRAWQPATPSDLEAALGISVGDSADWKIVDGQEILELNILNPVATFDGRDYPMQVQIVETVEATDWQKANITTAAKRKGKDGDYITHMGNYIFTKASIVFNTPEDVYLKPDTSKSVSTTVDTETGEILL
tara:strand:- start:19237 stop:19815 length:579 start_codon:yes stop_codon:yes gene_type:complete